MQSMLYLWRRSLRIDPESIRAASMTAMYKSLVQIANSLTAVRDTRLSRFSGSGDYGHPQPYCLFLLLEVSCRLGQRDLAIETASN